MEPNHREFVDLSHARLDEQRSVMEQIVKDGVCPFCPEHLEQYHKQPTLQENESWVLTKNQWPYEKTEVHLLAILRRHEEDLVNLTDEDWKNLGQLMRWAQQHMKLPGGAIGMRFGKPKFSGATVQHIHAQLIVPKKDETTGAPAQVALWTGTRNK